MDRTGWRGWADRHVIAAMAMSVPTLFAGCAPSPCEGALLCRWVEHPPEDPPLRAVAYGTSLTADGAWVASVSTELDPQYPDAVVFENTAESARFSGWGLENFRERVLDHAPDMLFIEFAVNDAYSPYETSVAQSRANMETMLDQLGLEFPECSVVLIVTNHVIGPGAEARPALADYYAEVRRIAAERDLLLVDEEPAWRLLHERAPEVFDVLVPDGLHPTYAGHDRMNRPLILDALDAIETDRDALVDRVIATTPLP